MSCHDHPWRRAFATCAASRVSARRRSAEAAFSPTRGSAPLAVEARSAVAVMRQEYLTTAIRQVVLTRRISGPPGLPRGGTLCSRGDVARYDADALGRDAPLPTRRSGRSRRDGRRFEPGRPRRGRILLPHLRRRPPEVPTGRRRGPRSCRVHARRRTPQAACRTVAPARILGARSRERSVDAVDGRGVDLRRRGGPRPRVDLAAPATSATRRRRAGRWRDRGRPLPDLPRRALADGCPGGLGTGHRCGRRRGGCDEFAQVGPTSGGDLSPLGRRRPRYPLSPEPRSEAMKCFWNTANSATAGAASTTAPARIAPNGLDARPAMLLM